MNQGFKNINFIFKINVAKSVHYGAFFVKNKEEMDKSFPPISIRSIYLKNIPIQDR